MAFVIVGAEEAPSRVRRIKSGFHFRASRSRAVEGENDTATREDKERNTKRRGKKAAASRGAHRSYFIIRMVEPLAVGCTRSL